MSIYLSSVTEMFGSICSREKNKPPVHTQPGAVPVGTSTQAGGWSGVDCWLSVRLPPLLYCMLMHMNRALCLPSLPTACSPLSSPYAAPLHSSHPATGSLIKPDLSPNYTHKVYMHSPALQLLQICYKE